MGHLTWAEPLRPFKKGMLCPGGGGLGSARVCPGEHPPAVAGRGGSGPSSRDAPVPRGFVPSLCTEAVRPLRSKRGSPFPCPTTLSLSPHAVLRVPQCSLTLLLPPWGGFSFHRRGEDLQLGGQ